MSLLSQDYISKCGQRYSLHTHTVCPRCFRWPDNRTPSMLDTITDAVLAYTPKPKSKAAKKRTRKAMKVQS